MFFFIIIICNNYFIFILNCKIVIYVYLLNFTEKLGVNFIILNISIIFLVIIRYLFFKNL